MASVAKDPEADWARALEIDRKMPDAPRYTSLTCGEEGNIVTRVDARAAALRVYRLGCSVVFSEPSSDLSSVRFFVSMTHSLSRGVNDVNCSRGVLFLE